MSKEIAVLLFIVYLSVPVSIGFASDTEYKPGELLVCFAPKENGVERNVAERNAVLTTLGGGEVTHTYKLVPGLTVVKLPPRVKVEDAVVKFNKAPGILYAEPNYKVKGLATFPNDPMFVQLWGMHNVGQTGGTPDADIDAPQAWDIKTNAGDIVVAVIDSGVDYTHPDLAANMWVNPGEIPNNGIDDDGNGYVDDIYGYDFCTWDDGQTDSDPMDDLYHGTHCTGTIGAIGNNGVGVTGVCWNVKIMALKFIAYDNQGHVADAIACIEYAVEMGAKVLSNSWGCEYNQSLKLAIDAANTNGVLFVAAAGNSGSDNDWSPVYPASYDCENIISVMATDANDERSIWSYPYSSNWGATSVDLAAPGSYILSTFPTYQTYEMAGRGYSTYYGMMGGTSTAAPHVAGACALIWSANPTLTHLQVKQIILNTVDELDELEGLCVTGGRLNLYKAVLEAAKNEQMLSKVDNVSDGDSVLPYNEITYTITYANPVINPELTGVIITDYLPDEVDYNSSPAGSYNPDTRTVTWNIPPLSPGSPSSSITLIVTVNLLAEPLGTITNRCDLRSNEYHTVIATEITNVGSWNPGVIYVDMSAPGSYTGMSWDDAYSDLQDALERARAGCGNQIWVAAGTYKPTTNTINPNYYATFQLVEGVPLYGGFTGNETSQSQRNWLTNQTILTGDINNDGNGDVAWVVTASSVGQANIIDGFIITKGRVAGIYCDGASPTIMHNTLQQNQWGIGCRNNSSPDIKACSIQYNSSGIDCRNSALTVFDCMIADNYGRGIDSGVNFLIRVSNCTFQNNGVDGIYDSGTSSTTITNNIIRRNGDNGIYCVGIGEGIEIKNNWIHNNGTYNYGDGIYVDNYSYPPAPVIIRNNTIIRNARYGINSSWSENVNISNCIIWNNTTGQLNNCNAIYSCTTDPGFMNITTDPNDLHIAENSPCKDTGNPSGNYNGETDIDGEGRVKYGRVDIGADEYYWSSADFNGDKFVNFIDYSEFALAWQSHPGDPNWNPDCNIGTPVNNQIDYNDLAVFCEDWLWQAGWTKTFTCGAGQGMIQTMAAGFAPAETSLQSISAEQQIEKVEPLKIEQLIKWLEELWLDPEARKAIDEDIWLKFIESLKEEL
jgi:parallel beta-helix repeat protein